MAVKSVCGIIIISDKPEKLSDFYARTLGLEFEREDHGGLAPHFGVDIGNVHFGIHPPENFSKEKSASKSSNTIIAFDVNSLSDCQKGLFLPAVVDSILLPHPKERQCRYYQY